MHAQPTTRSSKHCLLDFVRFSCCALVVIESTRQQATERKRLPLKVVRLTDFCQGQVLTASHCLRVNAAGHAYNAIRRRLTNTSNAHNFPHTDRSAYLSHTQRHTAEAGEAILHVTPRECPSPYPVLGDLSHGTHSKASARSRDLHMECSASSLLHLCPVQGVPHDSPIKISSLGASSQAPFHNLSESTGLVYAAAIARGLL